MSDVVNEDISSGFEHVCCYISPVGTCIQLFIHKMIILLFLQDVKEVKPAFSPVLWDKTNCDQDVIIIDAADDDEISNPFPFSKHFNPQLEVGIQAKKLNSHQQTKFVTAIANIMYTYKRKPSKEDFDCVARQCVEKFPFIASPITYHVRTIKGEAN